MKQVRWVIQNNLSAEGGDYYKMSKVCEELGLEYQGVQVIPFSPDLPPFIIDDKINIYYGATTLMYNLYHQFNKPVGLFFDDREFSMENYIEKYGEHMLNFGAEVTTFAEFIKEIHSEDKLFFVRPDADDKSFAGDVMEFAKIKRLVDGVTKADNVILNYDTKIVVGEPYNVAKEWRNYVVDGKVVTSSLYRKNFKLCKDGKDAPSDMIQFVEDRCREYTPHSIFAMDIALCGGDYYIIECGCLNSVGLYDCNVKNLIESVSKFVSK